MYKITRLSLAILTLLTLPACAVFRPPSNSAPTAVKLSVKTENGTTRYQERGEVIRFDYVVTNTGDAPLAEPVVISDTSKLVTCPAIRTVGDLDDVLDRNESITCTASYFVTQADLETNSIVSSAVAKVGNLTSNQASIRLDNYNIIVPVSGVSDTPPPALTALAGTDTREPASSGINIIQFDPGQTSYVKNGMVDPNQTIHFMVTALAGQKLWINISAAPNAVGAKIYATDGTPLKPLDASSTWETTIPTEGEYYLDIVNLVDSLQDYVLKVELSDEGKATASPQPSTTVEATQDTFAAEEAVIEGLPRASFEYIVPLTLKLNETFQVELHMSRSASAKQLATEIVTARALATSTAGTGTLVAPEGPAVMLGSGQVEVTPFMLAELTSENEEAFEVRALHQNPVQVVDETRTATWLWLITARKEGRQKLIFVISQQARSNDEAHWHTLETERREVQVNVTLDQRLGALDWKWIIGVLVTALLIPAFWRYVDNRRKAAAPKEVLAPPPARQKRTSKKKTKE